MDRSIQNEYDHTARQLPVPSAAVPSLGNTPGELKTLHTRRPIARNAHLQASSDFPARR